MKKIDILNFITDFRKAPNSIKTFSELIAHLGKENEPALNTMLSELKQLRTIKEVEVNGEHAKPHRLVREGDQIRISRGFGRHQSVIVRGVIDEHVKKSDARTLYEDLTPRPTPEEIELRRMERVYRAAAAAAGTDRRKRRSGEAIVVQ